EGCIMQGANIDRSVIGIRSRIGPGSQIRSSLLIGADGYETLSQMEATQAKGVPPIGIGAESVIENAIIDKNARVGRGVKIGNQEKAAKAARDLNIAKSYGSYEELLGDPEIDAVYIPLPNHLHTPYAIKAAEAGKHVLCEKPIALDAAEARSLLAVRDRCGVL